MKAIEFENIGKQYRLGLVSTKTISHDLNRWWAMNVLHKEDPYLKIGETNDRSHKGLSEYVWALKDINFSVEEGDVVGIVGKNGAGKSTLLKLLSRVTTPTIGTIKARGRIASLLEVGTGFHPEMTGRENIYMNGAIMGMTKAEITRKLDEIVDFSGCERYIDTPVKRYSSGMTVRLGFAIAAHLEPEILVVDEVLAVGDASFQKKAIGKMNDISLHEGRTVLFVSHQMNAVKALCKNGIVLNKGKIIKTGEINECINFYQKDLQVKSEATDLCQYSNEFFDLFGFDIVDAADNVINGFVRNDEKSYVRISIDIKKLHSAFTIGYAIYNEWGVLIYWSYATDDYADYKGLDIGRNTILGEIPCHFLNEGTYFVKLLASIHYQEWLVNPEAHSPSILYSVQGGLSQSPFWTMKRPGICAPILKWKRLN